MTQQQPAPKRTIKDSVFTDLFSDRKYLLQLYRVLHPEDTSATEDDLDLVTIQNVLTDNLYNDLGFMVGQRLMVLVEAQSTWSVNILLRALLYAAQTLKDFVKKNNLDIYQVNALALPKPELYLVYTGSRDPQKDTLTFSDAYFAGEPSDIEVRIHILSEGSSANILDQYYQFVKEYAQQVKKHRRTHEAIVQTIAACKAKNVLKDYLESREQEVITMMEALFSDKQIFDSYFHRVATEARQLGEEQGEERGIKKGINQGVEQGIRSLVEVCQELGVSLTDVAGRLVSKFNISEEEAKAKAKLYWRENLQFNG